MGAPLERCNLRPQRRGPTPLECRGPHLAGFLLLRGHSIPMATAKKTMIKAPAKKAAPVTKAARKTAPLKKNDIKAAPAKAVTELKPIKSAFNRPSLIAHLAQVA